FRSAYDRGVRSIRSKGAPHSPQNSIVGRFSCWHQGHVMPEPPAAGSAKGRNRGPRLTARDLHGQGHGHTGHVFRLAGCHRSWLPHNRVDALTGGPEQGWGPHSGFESFLLCYTAGRHEGARRKPKVELMTEPADRAVLLLQKVSELLLESRPSRM